LGRRKPVWWEKRNLGCVSAARGVLGTVPPTWLVVGDIRTGRGAWLAS